MNELPDMHRHFDLIVANIFSEALCEMSSDLAALQQPGDDLLLSGIIVERKDAPLRAFKDAGYSWVHSEVENEWILLHFKKV